MEILTKIANVLAIFTGSGVTAFAVVRLLGNKILENQFSKGIEKYKFRINSEFDRISKIHEIEFKVLPLLWQDISDTNNTFYLLNSLLQSYPDLKKLSPSATKEVYEEDNLKNSEIEMIESSYDKNKEYQRITYSKKYSKIAAKLLNFKNDYRKNKIFLTDEIDAYIVNIDKTFSEMLSNLSVAYYDSKVDYQFIEKSRNLQKTIDEQLNQLNILIKNRLRFNDAY